MPRYFFHLHDDLDVPDHEGAEFPDLRAARMHAQRSARHLMCDTLVSEGRIFLSHEIDIENEQGEVIATERFGDAIKIND